MYLPNIEQTQIFGGNGGSVYNAKSQIEFNTNFRLSKIKMRSGDLIDSIQFVFNDGVQQYELPAMGGTGGKPGEFVLSQGETIQKIIVKHSKFLSGLQFVTNTGRTSQMFGKGAGQRSEVIINGNLLAYGGRAGALIDAIQFYYWN